MNDLARYIEEHRDEISPVLYVNESGWPDSCKYMSKDTVENKPKCDHLINRINNMSEKEDVCRIKPDECEACRFETAELSFYTFGCGYPSKSGGWLCKVCGSTASGRAFYPPFCYKSPEILHMLAYCTNLIVKEIERVR